MAGKIREIRAAGPNSARRAPCRRRFLRPVQRELHQDACPRLEAVSGGEGGAGVGRSVRRDKLVGDGEDRIAGLIVAAAFRCSGLGDLEHAPLRRGIRDQEAHQGADIGVEGKEPHEDQPEAEEQPAELLHRTAKQDVQAQAERNMPGWQGESADRRLARLGLTWHTRLNVGFFQHLTASLCM